MNRKEFAQLVHQAVAGLSAAARGAMENVAFVLEDKVRRRKTREVGIRRDEILLGLYEGVPKTKRGADYFGVLPDKITLFREPLEQLADGDFAKLRRLVQDVVWHEVGHHLGFDEPAIRALEQKRGKRYN
jgi:predicted Zn-dependent protease with MMP-like domain